MNTWAWPTDASPKTPINAAVMINVRFMASSSLVA
jgi:hypothetical protein